MHFKGTHGLLMNEALSMSVTHRMMSSLCVYMHDDVTSICVLVVMMSSLCVKTFSYSQYDRILHLSMYIKSCHLSSLCIKTLIHLCYRLIHDAFKSKSTLFRIIRHDDVKPNDYVYYDVSPNNPVPPNHM